MGNLTCRPETVLIAGATPYDPEERIVPFCMDVHEYTQGEEIDLVLKSKFIWDLPPIAEKFFGLKKPVVNRTFDQAQAICHERGGKLPSDAQWEKAAAGPDGKNYPTASGDKAKKSEANYNSEGTVEVKRYKPNGFGVYDMGGNVAEWTDGGSGRFLNHKNIRGGSWYGYSWLMQVGDRLSIESTRHEDFVGLRCVFEPENSSKTM